VMGALPAERLEVHLRVVSDGEREATVTGCGTRYAGVARAWLGPDTPSVRE
jgi:hypothetical protein